MERCIGPRPGAPAPVFFAVARGNLEGMGMKGKPLKITPQLTAKVRSLRAYGLTLREIAARLGVTQSSALKIERARAPSSVPTN